MKRRFATKLILSGAALAVSAATLVSTTYAWYVQNSQVTADGVTGSTKDKDATSIFISKNFEVDGNAGDWTSSVAFIKSDDATNETIDAVTVVSNETRYVRDAAPAEGKVYNGGLDPVTRKSDGTTFVFVDDSTEKNGTATTDDPVSSGDFSYDVLASGRKIVFNLYVQSSTADVYVRPTLRIANTTTAATINSSAQTAYRHVKYGANNDVEKGDKFWIDAVQALRMSVTSTVDDGAAWSATTDTKYYDVLSVAKNINLTGSAYTTYTLVTSKDGVTNTKFIDESQLVAEDVTYAEYGQAAASHSVKGAHAYFAGLTGAEPKATFADRAASTYVDNSLNKEIQITKLASANTAYKFTFELWLEGTDEACFDSCANQTFEIGVDFTAVTTGNIKFNSNGGTAVAPISVALGGKASAPTAPTKDGFNFGGWYTDAALTNEFNFATTDVEGDLTLYAKWTA